jgi:hypothetical protein
VRAIQLCALIVAAFVGPSAAERYANVLIEPDGGVTVITEDGRRITTPSKDDDQVGADRAAVAPDRQSVGWLATYSNCCTSYPLPLKLMILWNGQLRTLKAKHARPIWYWTFQGGGKFVAFRQETTHGSQGLHYERWDVVSGRRVADYMPEYDENGHTVSRPHEPKWVRALDAAEKNQQH